MIWHTTRLLPWLLALLIAMMPGCGKPTLCGFAVCHGAEVSCSIDAPEVCTEIYQLGDRCRKLARCTMKDNLCELETDPGYQSCLDCVKECAKLDGEAAFACETEC